MKTILSTWSQDYNRTHGSVARILAQEKHIEVIIKGEGFANSSDFRILDVVGRLVRERPPTMTRTALEESCRKTAASYTQTSKQGRGKAASVIFMPEIPEDSPPRLKKALDGGLLHEVFHSLYTVRGNPDTDRLFDVLSSNWDADKLKRVGGLVKPFWNVFEDVMIERIGCANFPGAPDLLQAVHHFVWDQEVSKPPTIGTTSYLYAHAVGYLRDYCKSLVYLKNIPTYDPDVTQLFGKEIIDKALAAKTSYDTLEIALEVVYLLHDLWEDPPESSKDKGEDESKGGEKGEDDPSAMGEEIYEEGGDEGEGDGENDGDGEDSEDDTSDQQGGASDDKASDDKASDDAGQGASADDEGDKGVGNQDLSEAIQEAVRKHMEHVFQTGALEGKIVRPPQVRDTFSEPNTKKTGDLQRSLRAIQPELAKIRPPLVALLDNRDHMVRKPYQENGRSLSSRSLTTVMNQKPRPFELRYQERAEKSCVLIMLDLSGSMQSCIDIARDATLSVSLVLKSCNIPFAVVGFTSEVGMSNLPKGYTHGDRLVIHVAKDFHEPLSLPTQEKIVALTPSGATPLPDAFDLGVKILKTRHETRKHLFVVSDGAPFYILPGGVDTLFLLKKRMQDAQRHVHPFLLNVDAQGISAHTKGLPNTQTIRKFQDMPNALLKHLQKIKDSE